MTLFLAALSQDESQIVNLECELEAKKLELQNLPSLFAENFTMRKEVDRLVHSVETLVLDRTEAVRLAQNVLDSVAVS